MTSMRTSGDPRVVLAVVAFATVVLAGTVAVVVAGSDDDESPAVSTTSTTSRPTSTTSQGVSDAEAATIVWPDPAGSLTYDAPMDAARAFAEEFIGFDDPVTGEFQQGDRRSGEVEIRPVREGPVSTVIVRMMRNDRWYVIGATSPELELDIPTAGSAIDHPLQVAGRARGFQAQVRVTVYRRGATTPLGAGSVAAGGTSELGPFAGAIPWDNPGGGWGSVVLTTAGGPDGATWAAMAIPVGFIGGD